MRVEWTEQAREGRKQIAAYIRWRFGFKHAKIFMQEVNRTVKMLMHSPNIGAFEPLLADLPSAYRSIVINHLSKIVYRIESNAIYIVDFWDVRRDPKSLAAEVKDYLGQK